jgi:hypothetical protein
MVPRLSSDPLTGKKCTAQRPPEWLVEKDWVMAAEVQRAIEVAEFIHGTDSLPKVRLDWWLRSNDPDVLGAVYFAAAHHWARIEPRTTRIEFGRLVGRVLAVALRAKGRTHFSMDKYRAARTFMGWMLECFQDRKDDPEAERSLKWAVAFLAALYRKGSAKDRRCVVDGVLEHLFESKGMAEYFKHGRTIKCWDVRTERRRIGRPMPILRGSPRASIWSDAYSHGIQPRRRCHVAGRPTRASS